MPPTARDVGPRGGDRAMARPVEALDRARDAVGDIDGTIAYDVRRRCARVLDVRGREVPPVTACRFVWSVSDPRTAVYRAAQDRAADSPSR